MNTLERDTDQSRCRSLSMSHVDVTTALSAINMPVVFAIEVRLN